MDLQGVVLLFGLGFAAIGLGMIGRLGAIRDSLEAIESSIKSIDQKVYSIDFRVTSIEAAFDRGSD